MAQHNAIGKQGEELARKYLESKGYRIVEKNYKTRRGEIDLVARYKNELVIIEVRTKHHEQFGTPEETIDYKKRLRLLRNANAYIAKVKHVGPYRIDAVCVIIDQNNELKRINHYESICS